MADLTPRTRSESFLNGEDLEPITRREHFYAGRENELPEGHQNPETREEWFIKKYREAGDVTVESLSIAENGTYTAPSGKAYSPVSVNVPLPDNAYLLQSIEHEQVATFADGTDNFVKALEVAIEPVQDLHGYDRPWVGGSGKNLVGFTLPYSTGSSSYSAFTSNFTLPKVGDNIRVSAKCSDGTVITDAAMVFQINSTQILNMGLNQSYEITQEMYDRLLTANRVRFYTPSLYANKTVAEIQLEVGTTATSFEPYENICPIIGHTEANVVVSPTTDAEDGSTYTIDLDGTRYGGKLDVVSGVLTLTHGFISSYNGETLPSTWISDRDVYAEGTTPTIGAEVVYELATPQTIQLSPTIIKSLQGGNNFFASTGEIEILQYWAKEVS